MKKKKILLVLKDIHILRLYREEFEDEGYNVSGAGSGHEALEKTATEKFDLVILDAVLPDMASFDLIREIKTASPETKIIAASSYLLKDLDSRIESVIDAFDSKSSDLDELKETINKLLKE